MMWETSVLPQNGRLLAVGGGREAMANDAHGVDVCKNREAPVCKKKVKKRVVTWNFGESPLTIVMSVRSMYMATIWGKIVKPAVPVKKYRYRKNDWNHGRWNSKVFVTTSYYIFRFRSYLVTDIGRILDAKGRFVNFLEA